MGPELLAQSAPAVQCPAANLSSHCNLLARIAYSKRAGAGGATAGKNGGTW
jgi:hypothetical protein